jgi:hypothetical protein
MRSISHRDLTRANTLTTASPLLTELVLFLNKRRGAWVVLNRYLDPQFREPYRVWGSGMDSVVRYADDSNDNGALSADLEGLLTKGTVYQNIL